MGLRRKYLGREEEVVVEFQGHRGPFLLPLLVLVTGLGGFIAASMAKHLSDASIIKIAGLAVGVLAIVAFLIRFGRWQKRKITITTQRLIVRVAGIRPRREQVSLERIVEIQIAQTVSDHFFGRGDLILELVDGQPVVVADIGKPEAVRRVLERFIRSAVSAGEIQTTTADEPMTPVLEESYGAKDDRGRGDPDLFLPILVTEFDPTPLRGTPAISGSLDQDRLSRLSAIDDLEAAGVISAQEASEQRRRIAGRRGR